MNIDKLIKKVTDSELEFLTSQAKEYCESPEEFAEWKKDMHDPLKKKFVNCESINDLRTVLEDELGIENPSEYILDNYIIE
jgi:hypothetical protein